MKKQINDLSELEAAGRRIVVCDWLALGDFIHNQKKINTGQLAVCQAQDDKLEELEKKIEAIEEKLKGY